MTIVLVGENRLAKDSLAEAVKTVLDTPIFSADNLSETCRHLAEIGVGAECLLLIDYDTARSGEGWETARTGFPANARLAVYSAPGVPDEAMRWLQLGWDGYLPRTMTASAIVCAIRLMLRGERFVPSITVSASPAGHGPRIELNLLETGLSPRQRQILSLVATGASNKHIARALSVEEVTVKSHIKAIFRKLNVRSRTEAARYAFAGQLHGAVGVPH
jgi:DNA-binding NarL/FixJ family response regulator